MNRKRVQRVMRAHRLLQPVRGEGRRRRPGFFRVTRPDELWHLDMTKVWTAQHGWVYLHAIIDCCTREIVGWNLELRCQTGEAVAVVETAVVDRRVEPGVLTLGTDNGSQFTSRDFAATSPLEVWHIGGAATATPSPRPSSSPGSGSSRNAAPGEPNGRASTRPAPGSPPTSTPTTTGPTPGSATKHPPKSPPPGDKHQTYKPETT